MPKRQNLPPPNRIGGHDNNALKLVIVVIIRLRNHDAERIDAKTPKQNALLILAASPPWSPGRVIIIAVIIGLKLP